MYIIYEYIALNSSIEMIETFLVINYNYNNLIYNQQVIVTKLQGKPQFVVRYYTLYIPLMYLKYRI